MNRTVVIGVGLLVAGVVAFALIQRRHPKSPERVDVSLRAPIPAEPIKFSAIAPARSGPPPADGPVEAIRKANDLLRVQTTYDNFRAALATGNQHIENALLPILLKDRLTALQLAEADLSSATRSEDRQAAERAVEALRR